MPSIPAIAPLHLVRLRPEHLEILSVETDHDRAAGWGQHGADPLVGVGPNDVLDPRVALDDRSDRVHGRVVVGVRADAHPELRGVDADHLV